MKKIVVFLAILIALLMLAIGCSNEVGNKSSNGGTGELNDSPKKVLRFMTNGNDNSDSFRAITSIAKKYQEEVNPNFSMEIESIPNQSQYFQKLQTYIASNQMPDFFKLPNGPIAETLVKENKLVDIKATLREFGQFENYHESVIDFLSFKDGSLYLLPEGRYGEAFWYYTEPFKELGIEEPTTFEEFLDISQKLKDAGYTPINVAGKERWQLIRYLSHIPLRLTHYDFIDELKTGEISLTSEIGMKSLNFLYDLGQMKAFQTGFSNTDYTDSINQFLGGKAVMHYNGSWEISQFAEKYADGEIDYFFIPDVESDDNKGPNTSITAGLAYAFNAETFDEPTKDFFKYVVENYHQSALVEGFMSPLKGELPEDATKLLEDFSNDLDKVLLGGLSWDDKLDPASTEAMGVAANELALGMITPEEFAKRLDKTIAENAPAFFNID
ncbi:extracellular solute-binding protein [Bacillus sp. FJAT-50079]|uniref:ABC transporter substrate-binding protein n=1 Tax=Bacillus sp. FJAT-50079 TaxID=2833577 RepID=UPI001BC9FFD1|nr:extracellular solute-binding protein [Bacillus sp. FJAT-50079]MBS4206587.1 extracellular solute-binding protein [Bacillus sp. FJAT-50079]